MMLIFRFNCFPFNRLTFVHRRRTIAMPLGEPNRRLAYRDAGFGTLIAPESRHKSGNRVLRKVTC